MWNPVKIEFENLFSHRHSVYEFKNNKCVVIFGKNLSDKSLDNNGAGKTTLFEAISIALTNDSLRGVKKDAFINRNATECVVRFDLTNKVINKDLRIIRRYFRGSKPVQVEIWENNVLNTQIVSVNDANKRIIDLLGISREDLLRYFIISQDNHYTFFTASDSEKKEVMNRITSADVLNPLMDTLGQRLDNAEESLNNVQREISRLEQRKATLEEQHQDIINNNDITQRINEIEDKINEEKEGIKSLESMKQQYIAKRNVLDAAIKNIKIEDITQLYERRKAIRGKINELEEGINNNERAHRKIKLELENKMKCPKCGEVFIVKSELKLSVKDAEKLLKQAHDELIQQNKTLDKLNGELKKLTETIRQTEVKEQELNTLKNKHIANERLIGSTEDSITLSKKHIKQWQAEIIDIRSNTEGAKILKDIESKIRQCSVELESANKKLEPIVCERDMIKFWQFNMGRTGFMTYLANRSVKIIEGVTNSYLRKFGVDISVVVNGFKVLKSGEVKEKIDVFITNDGITAEPFMAKSGGERGRVVLAGILGIQHLINLSTNGLGLNLLVLDEALSGIDCNGTLEIIKTIDNLGSTVMMITQNIEDSSICSNYLEVVKENGVSKIL